MIRKLHHAAYRCRDTEATRGFYEDFLGLRLAHALEVELMLDGRPAHVLHSFFELGDGSYLAFFEVPARPFDFKRQSDLDLHIALEVDEPTFIQTIEAAKVQHVEVRGPVDHGMVQSAYFRDPDGYVVELAVRSEAHDRLMNPVTNDPHAILQRWQLGKHAVGAPQVT